MSEPDMLGDYTPRLCLGIPRALNCTQRYLKHNEDKVTCSMRSKLFLQPSLDSGYSNPGAFKML